MRRRPERMLVLLLAAGLALRLVLAATTEGNTFDLSSYVLVREALLSGPGLDLYGPELFYAPLEVHRWPYPPGFLPFLLVLGELGDLVGVSLRRLARLPAIAADLAIAWMVFAALRTRLGSDRALLGAAAVALGPSFVALSGHHGQVDAVAVAPVVGAVILWGRSVPRRWLWCGLLVGAAASVKAPLGVLVLALLPTARDLPEALRTLATAVALPLVALAPFLLADPGGVRESLSYAGLPGGGGLSLLVQPEMATFWLSGEPVVRSDISDALQEGNRVLVLVAALATALVLIRRRTPAPAAAAALVLAMWIFGVNYSLGYALWGLPFFLLAGWVRAALALQAALLIPTLMVYLAPIVDGWSRTTVLTLFVPSMLGVLLAWGAAWWQLVVVGRPRGLDPAG